MRTIRSKMILYIMPAVFLVLAVSTAITFYVTARAERQCAFAQTLATSRDYANEFDAQMRSDMAISRTLASAMALYTSNNRGEVSGMLRELLVKNPRILGVYVGYEPNAFDGLDARYANTPGYDATGRFIPYWSRLGGSVNLRQMKDVETSDYYRLPKRMKTDQVIEPYIYEGALMASLISPIMKRGAFAGIAGVDITLGDLDAAISRIKIFETGYAILLSNTGIFVSCRNKTYIGTKTIAQLSQEINNPALARIADDIRQGREGMVRTTDPDSGKDVVMFYTPVKTGNWSMIIVAPLAEMLAVARQVEKIMVLVGLFAMGGVGIVIIFIAGSLAQPIISLSRVADRVAAGHLDVKVEEQEGEIGVLARAFNRMTEQLCETLAKLHSSEAYFRSLIESASDIITIIDLDGVIRYESPSLMRLTDFSPEELLGASVFEYIHPDDVPTVKQMFMEFIRQGGISPPVEMRVKHRNGSWVHVESIAHSLIKDAVMTGVVVSSRDITERKRAAEDLSASESKYRHLYESMMDAYVSVDRDGRIVEFNEVFRTITGYEPDELRTLNYRDITPEKWHAFEAEILEKQADVRGYTDIYEKEYRRKDGSIIPIEIRTYLLKDRQDNTCGLWGIVRDISDRKRVENELKKYRDHLEELVRERTTALEAANQELESFSYSISHDLRAPLRAIDGFSKMLQDDYSGRLDKEATRFIEVIRKNTRYMGQLIDDLLVYAHLGRQEFSVIAIEMSELVQTVFEELRLAIPERKVDFRVGALPVAEGDIAMVRQVLTNLLSNALKFTRTRETTVIEVGSFDQNGKMVYYIRDNGVGFDMAYVDKLFKVFSRLHSAGEYEGTGVGLAMVERIIRKHGGTVWAEGKLNEGAVFYFSLA